MNDVTRLDDGDEVTHLVAPVVLAFASDPFVRWLLPDPAVYLEAFSTITRLHLARVGPHGGAFESQAGRAAAVWYPPGVTPDGSALREVMVRAGAGERMTSVWPLVEPHEPSEPHWYLRQIGVDPLLQGRGAGNALLREGLALVDRCHDLAYLEATTPSSRALYERHGFRALAEISVDGSPPLWPMLRARA